MNFIKILKKKQIFIPVIAVVVVTMIIFCCLNSTNYNEIQTDNITVQSNIDKNEIKEDSFSTDAVCEIAKTVAAIGIIEDKVTGSIDEGQQVEQPEIQVIDNSITASIEELVIDIPNVDCHYEFAYLNDAHVITGEMDDISADNIENVQLRRDGFASSSYSDSTFISLCSQIDGIAGSGVILNGDIVDYVSTSNINALRSGLDMINGNIMYLRADHDYGVWYSDNLSYSDSYNMQSGVIGDGDVTVWNYPEFKIIGINNTTSQISENTMSLIENTYYADEKPVIFISHVPVNSIVDTSYGETIANAWGGRNLSWGYGCTYEPNDTTKRWLDMIYDENTHVVAVIAGHVHMSYDYMITNKVRGHIFAPSFIGTVGKIIVV